MKSKMIPFLSAIVISTAVIGSIPSVFAVSSVLLGDVNNDTEINAFDAAEILIEAAHIGTGETGTFSETQSLAADVNTDTAVDSVDAAIVLSYASYVGAGGTLMLEEYLQQQDAPAEPLEITTDGGAVLVGAICYDGTSWYFEPEEPINLTYTYFYEMPLYFENATRIEMYPEADDGVNKLPYLNEIVTITGNLQAGFDMSTLYFVPYTIEHGRTVDRSHAAVVEYPSEVPEYPYDPSKQLPEEMAVSIVDNKYQYNPYRLSTEAVEVLGNDFADFYVDFVRAWMNYETSCPCPNLDYAQMLPSVLYYEFPMFTADGEFNALTDYNAESGTLTWRYTTADKAAHDEIIAEFTALTNAYLENADPAASLEKRAESVYHAMTTSLTYDYDILETRKMTESYYGYIRQKGICITFADMYAQLLAQVGIDSLRVFGINSNNDAHAWNLVEIDGVYYHFDTTYEIGHQEGQYYLYFKQTHIDRLLNGYDEEKIEVGRYRFGPISDVYCE